MAITTQIRFGAFETNSSSTHSITMCSRGDFEAWQRGELLYNSGSGYGSTSPLKDKQFVTLAEAVEILTMNTYGSHAELANLSPEEQLEYLADRDNDVEFYTCDGYFEDEYLETFEETFTTPGGEKVVAFGKYGHD